MSKEIRLYFLRHGVAVEHEAWKDSDDELRPLTSEGAAAMEREAQAIAQMNLRLEHLISSPLVRASETAVPVARALSLEVQYSDLLKPGFDIHALEKLLKQITDQNDVSSVMIVGHESDFSQTISALIGGGKLALKKGGLAQVNITKRNLRQGELIFLLLPANLGAKLASEQ